MTTTQLRDGGTGTAIAERLTAAIRKEHDAALSAASKALHHALEAGRLLDEARQQVQHGSWESYVRDSCGIAPRTASLYLRLHRNRDRLPNRQRVADLSVRQAAKLLSKPKEATVDVRPDATGAEGGHPTLMEWMGKYYETASVLAHVRNISTKLSAVDGDLAEWEEGRDAKWIAEQTATLEALRTRMLKRYTTPAWFRSGAIIYTKHANSGAIVVFYPHESRADQVGMIACFAAKGGGAGLKSPGLRVDELEAVMHDLDEVEGLPWSDDGAWSFTYKPLGGDSPASWSSALRSLVR